MSGFHKLGHIFENLAIQNYYSQASQIAFIGDGWMGKAGVSRELKAGNINYSDTNSSAVCYVYDIDWYNLQVRPRLKLEVHTVRMHVRSLETQAALLILLRGHTGPQVSPYDLIASKKGV